MRVTFRYQRDADVEPANKWNMICKATSDLKITKVDVVFNIFQPFLIKFYSAPIKTQPQLQQQL
jgi:hypothetical protein